MRIGSSGYALVNFSFEDDDDDAEATNAPPEEETMDIEVIIAALEAPTYPGLSSTRVHEHLARLKATMTTILENQVQILECFNCI